MYIILWMFILKFLTQTFVTENVVIFQPSSSFIIADMRGLRLEIQLTPIMQLYIVASTTEKGKLSGEFYNLVVLENSYFLSFLQFLLMLIIKVSV